MRIIKLALLELRKKFFFAMLSFLVCLVAFYLIISSITTVSSTIYQKKVLFANVDIDFAQVIHLSYRNNDENQEYISKLNEFRSTLKKTEGVKAIGEFDASGQYFKELRDNENYIAINQLLVNDSGYKKHPGISRIIRIDEELLGFFKTELTAYSYPPSGNLPIYPSIAFKELLPLGSILTDEQFGDVYEVVGYLEKQAKWADENDLIRFPLIDLNGYFVAPWSEQSHEDIMTRLSSLHNTYILTTIPQQQELLKTIETKGRECGLTVSGEFLSDEYAAYDQETAVFAKRHFALAVFLAIMATSSVIAVFTTNVLLKKKQYGILIANGFNKQEIISEIAVEVGVIILSSALIAWLFKEVELLRGKDIFKEILLLANLSFTLPICLLLAIVLIGLTTIIPANKIYRYSLAELIGGNNDGHH